MSVLTSSQILTAGQKEVIITCIRQPRACPMADPSGKVQWQILQVFLELEPRQRRRDCHTEGKTCRLVTLVHHSKCSWRHILHKICQAYPLLCHNGTSGEPCIACSCLEPLHTADHSIEQEITFSGKLTLKGGKGHLRCSTGQCGFHGQRKTQGSTKRSVSLMAW